MLLAPRQVTYILGFGSVFGCASREVLASLELAKKEVHLAMLVLVYLWVSQSITSAVLGGTIIIFYSLTIVHENSAMVFAWIVFILGIVEFAIGIWAAVCVCLMKPCRNIAPPQQVSSLPE
ncbi:uncharacterized protein LOC144665413 [Oculina patagonica]